MGSDWQLVKKLSLETILNVSSRSQGLVLFLPKNLVETYGIVSGDRLKVGISEHLRKKVEG